MEFLPILAEYTIKPIGRQLGYVVHCRTNLQNLNNKVEELQATRQTIENRIAEATRKGEEIQQDVSLWLTRVDEIIAQTDELLNDESQAKLKCLNGCCPNLTARHQISRNSTKLLEDVEEYRKKEFPQVSFAAPRKEVLDVTDKGYQDFQSRMSIVKKVMDSLKESVVQRVGVYGLGGVGKTTLAKEVYRQASEDKNLFDNVVILLDVKGNPDKEAIQKKIVEKLDMDIRQTETIEGRARRLCARIQEKKILIILDDVQEKIELENMGVPCLPTCKVFLTCRNGEVLVPHKMNADRVFPLDLLDKEETWSLFENKAGEVVKHNGSIRTLAMQIAERCGGLPLLVITVASVLRGNENIPIWRNALRQLEGFDKEDSTETAYLTLEWSYDQLGSTELQQLFLLCGIMVRENHVYVADLLKYCLGLDLLTNSKTVERAHDKLEALLDRLKKFCLLLDGEPEFWNCRRRVRMHDLVCLVANRIARRGEQVLSTEYRGDLKELPDKGFLRKCTKFSLILRSVQNFPELCLECPEVELFHLEGDYGETVVIPSNFFCEMQKLKVLVFTHVHMSIGRYNSTRASLSPQYLKMLQTLRLDGCTFGEDITLLGQLSSLEVLSLEGSYLTELPREIGQLTRLRLLDLSECSQLEVIPPTVISSLGRLEELNMRNSFSKWEMEGARAKSNASLSELKHLSQLSALEVRIPNADILPANLFSHKLTRYNICIGDVWKERMGEVTLNTLKLKLTIDNIMELDECLKSLLKSTEDLSLDKGATNIVQQLDPKYYENLKHLQLLRNNFESTYIINAKVVCLNLVTLKVHGCDKSRFLFSSSTAKSLVQLEQLEVSRSTLLQEVVSSTRECGNENTNDMFPKLKVLKLEKLPNLARFGIGNYTVFPALENLEINRCIKLVEFIGDSRTCKQGEQRVLEEEENLDIRGKNILFDEKVVCPNLITLKVHGCHKSRFLFSSSTAKSLVRLEQLEVSRSNLLQEVVSSTRECGNENTDDMFPKLKVLKLEKLPNFARFGIGNYIEFPALENLEINWCVKLVEFIGDKVATSSKDARTSKEIEQSVLEDEQTSKKILFDGKSGFPRLMRLSINKATKLKAIWHVQLAGDSFRRLKQVHVKKCNNLTSLFRPSLSGRLTAVETLEIEYCGSLEAIFELHRRSDVEEIHVDTSVPHDRLTPFDYQNLDSIRIWKCKRLKQIFPASVARGLQNLTRLDVYKCGAIEEIVGEEEEKEGLETIPPHFIFPKVTNMGLYDLPQLSSLYPKTHVSSWPLLEELDVRGCDKVRVLAARFPISHPVSKSTLFSIKREDSFPKLEKLALSRDMEIWNGPTQDSQLVVFAKLKSITFGGENWATKFSYFLFLQGLQNLEEINVQRSACTEISVNQGISSNTGPGEEIHDVDDVAVRSGALPRVTTLRLYFMERLMDLGNADSFRSPLFPNLKTLSFWYCHRLKSIQSSAISFRNLTSLAVNGCDGLKYLASYSVAKSLVQLERLDVQNCKRIEVIVSGNGDDADAAAGGNEISFSRLQLLMLCRLPRLQRFYSGNCTLKFPSSMTLHVGGCRNLKLKISPDGVLQTTSDRRKKPRRFKPRQAAAKGTGSASMPEEAHQS